MPEQVKQQFALHGLSIREWAAARGFSESLVYTILRGKNKALRGQSFHVAVVLGLKVAPPLQTAPVFVTEVLAYRSTDAERTLVENTMT